MTVLEDAVVWSAELERLGARLAPRFTRLEPRRRLLAYLRGLLAPVERKNGWQLAESAGDATPDGMQDFLGRMRWDADQVRDDLQAYRIASPEMLLCYELLPHLICSPPRFIVGGKHGAGQHGDA